MVLDEYGVEVAGPLERWAREFASALASVGYAWCSIRDALFVFAFVSRWLGTRRLGPRALTADRIKSLQHARRGRRCRYSLPKILGFLRGAGVVPSVRPKTKRTSVDRVVERYRAFLADERGLAASVVRRRCIVARRFLESRRRGDLGTLSAGEVRDFLRRETRGHSPGHAADLAYALRSFLRFLHSDGRTHLSLVAAVPAIARWRLAALPRALAPRAVRQLLLGCDRRTLMGRRDFAVMMLLVRLGLRAGEVAGLDLGAFDWRRGEVIVRGKGKTVSRLPVPHDVGEAVSAYLLRRPRVGSRAAFLRTRAPLQRLTQPAITHVVARASRRAGLARVSPHKLRHTLATEMLRRGAPLAEIAQVLRHRSLATTAIYAKVDRAALHEVAQPWPGGLA